MFITLHIVFLLHFYIGVEWQPFFLNGKFSTKFRDKACVDGSFLAKRYHFLGNYHHPSSTIIGRRRKKVVATNSNTTVNDVISIDWKRDPYMKNKSWGDFIKLTSKDGIWDMVQRGEKFARIMEERGEFQSLPKLILWGNV